MHKSNITTRPQRDARKVSRGPFSKERREMEGEGMQQRHGKRDSNRDTEREEKRKERQNTGRQRDRQRRTHKAQERVQWHLVIFFFNN